jgi:hypothetical protein
MEIVFLPMGWETLIVQFTLRIYLKRNLLARALHQRKRSAVCVYMIIKFNSAPKSSRGPARRPRTARPSFASRVCNYF